MEIAIIGADIQEIIGSAIALRILFNIPIQWGAVITIFDTFSFMLIHYTGVRKMEAFFGILIMIMMICFTTNFFKTDPNWREIAKG